MPSQDEVRELMGNWLGHEIQADHGIVTIIEGVSLQGNNLVFTPSAQYRIMPSVVKDQSPSLVLTCGGYFPPVRVTLEDVHILDEADIAAESEPTLVATMGRHQLHSARNWNIRGGVTHRGRKTEGEGDICSYCK